MPTPFDYETNPERFCLATRVTSQVRVQRWDAPMIRLPDRDALRDDQGVAGPELVQELGEGGAVGAGAAGGLGEHPIAAGAL